MEAFSQQAVSLALSRSVHTRVRSTQVVGGGTHPLSLHGGALLYSCVWFTYPVADGRGFVLFSVLGNMISVVSTDRLLDDL